VHEYRRIAADGRIGGLRATRRSPPERALDTDSSFHLAFGLRERITGPHEHP
jgi:hypothetical protein